MISALGSTIDSTPTGQGTAVASLKLARSIGNDQAVAPNCEARHIGQDLNTITTAISVFLSYSYYVFNFFHLYLVDGNKFFTGWVEKGRKKESLDVISRSNL